MRTADDPEGWLRAQLASLEAPAEPAVILALPAKRAIAGTSVVAGEVRLTGRNPTAIVTGLRRVDGVILTIKGTVPPGLTGLTYDVIGGTVHVHAWKSVGGTDPTRVASTGTETVSYVIVGD